MDGSDGLSSRGGTRGLSKFFGGCAGTFAARMAAAKLGSGGGGLYVGTAASAGTSVAPGNCVVLVALYPLLMLLGIAIVLPCAHLETGSYACASCASPVAESGL